MTTKEFISLHLGKMSDYLYRRMTEYQEVRDVWQVLGASQRINILDIEGFYHNLETSVALIHREILMDCVQYLSAPWCRRTVLAHIDLVDRYLENKSQEVSKPSVSLVLEKGNAGKMSISEKKVYQLLMMFPSRPKGWIERSVNYSSQIGIPTGRTIEIFDLWLPNPYEKANYAPVT